MSNCHMLIVTFTASQVMSCDMHTVTNTNRKPITSLLIASEQSDVSKLLRCSTSIYIQPTTCDVYHGIFHIHRTNNVCDIYHKIFHLDTTYDRQYMRYITGYFTYMTPIICEIYLWIFTLDTTTNKLHIYRRIFHQHTTNNT